MSSRALLVDLELVGLGVSAAVGELLVGATRAAALKGWGAAQATAMMGCGARCLETEANGV